MNSYVTTYRKDYLWPYGKSFPMASVNDGPLMASSPKPGDLPDKCKCTVLEAQITMKLEDPLGDPCGEQQWSRAGPMGPLLDAKLHPAKMGASPETESSSFNQPNAFLARLQEKYPILYDVLQKGPAEDVLARVDADRMRTTYQVDYCGMAEYPTGVFDDLLGAEGKDGMGPCTPTSRLPIDPCRPNRKQIATRQSSQLPEPELHVETCIASPIVTGPDQTEYMDNFSRIGGLIMKDNLHGHHLREPSSKICY